MAHPETQEHVRAIRVPIFPGPVGGAGWHRARGLWRPLCPWGCLLCLRTIEGDRRGILVQPGSGHGLHLQGLQCQGATHPVDVGGTEGLQNLPSAVIVACCLPDAILSEREYPALVQPSPHLIEGMMPVKPCENPCLHAPATGEPMGRVRMDQAVDDGGNVQLTYHTQDQRSVGYRTDLMHGDCHDETPLDVSIDGFIIAEASTIASPSALPNLKSP